MNENLETKRYVVGIDLGTTNSAVAFVDMELQEPGKKRIATQKIPQLTGPAEISALPVLPSFLYIPGEYDLPKEAVVSPWGGAEPYFAGVFARDHGASVPSRLVASAKSWLVHDQVDRRARILPWGAGKEIRKVSPVEASAAYLMHIRNVWNRLRGEDEALWLENQLVVLTVPASFDEVARELTLEAARQAGLPKVILLEEPVAVFYSWLNRHEKDWKKRVKPDELILVCDVGGGTTDFTLIILGESRGVLRFERIAVGNHLILGGDNIDLALAAGIESTIQAGRSSLTGDQWKGLCQQCRQAKEVLLEGLAERFTVTLTGKGAKLIGGTMKATLDRATVERTVLEGFFPAVDAEPPGPPAARKGLTEFGLPYETEPAVTRHLGWFLDRHGEQIRNKLNREDHMPDLILFNGGSLKPIPVQRRIVDAIRHWFHRSEEHRPRILENPVPDQAVALGAAYYGLVKAGQGVRVGAGSPRSYYLGITSADGETRDAEKEMAICLVERGMEEGSDITLEDRQFEVLTNRPVKFSLYSSSFRAGSRSGEVIPVDDTLTPMPPLKTVVEYGKKGVQKQIPVRIEARYTEVGTLALWCRSAVSDHRWQLQFQLRDAPEAMDISEEAVLETSVVQDVLGAVKSALAADSDPSLLENLVNELERITGRDKTRWPLGLIRQMADVLLELQQRRGTSPRHEARWMNLTGFCLRPGYGTGSDPHRVQRLFKLYGAGLIFANKPPVRNEWWILWRRVAGGLKTGHQQLISQELSPIMMPKKGRKVKLHRQEQIEIWMAVANMERMGVEEKRKWGRRLMDEIGPKKTPRQLFWALGRIGARRPLYGPADRVLPPEEVSEWIERLLAVDWPSPQPIAAALTQLARRTGDRVRDLDDALMDRVIDRLARHATPENELRPLQEAIHYSRSEKQVVFGEDLPEGLVLTD
jgi:molecular chaperone DnaK (HSP70)